MQGPGEDADLVLELDPRSGVEVALPDLGRGRGEGQDRPGHATCHEPQCGGEQGGRRQPDDRDDEGQLARRRERLVLRHLGDQSRLTIRQPAVHADDRRAGRVRVQAPATLRGDDRVDGARARGRCALCRGATLDQDALRPDEERLAGRPETGPLNDDPVESREARGSRR